MHVTVDENENKMAINDSYDQESPRSARTFDKVSKNRLHSKEKSHEMAVMKRPIN
jgi:hypothetical protein